MYKIVLTQTDGTQKLFFTGWEEACDLLDKFNGQSDCLSCTCEEMGKQFKNNTEFDFYIKAAEKKYRAEHTTGNEMLDAVSLFMPIDYLIEQLKNDGYTNLNDLTKNGDLYAITSETTGETFQNQTYNLTIKDARKLAGLTQQQMSDMLGIPKRTIEDWDAGKFSPPEYVKKLIVEKLKNL